MPAGHAQTDAGIAFRMAAADAGDQAGEQADAEFQDKGFKGVDAIPPHNIEQPHADGAGQAPLPAADEQGGQDGDHIAEMDKRIAHRRRIRNPDKPGGHKGQGGEHGDQHRLHKRGSGGCSAYGGSVGS